MASSRDLLSCVCFLLLLLSFRIGNVRSFSLEHRNKRQTSTCTCSNWSQWIRCLPDPITTRPTVQTAPPPTQGICASPEIGAVAADVVFIIDESGSVGPINFRKELNFAECVVNKTVIGPTMVQVGLITYNWYAHSKFFLGDHRDRASLRSALSDIKYYGGSSYMDKGLRYARLDTFRRTHGMRDSAQQIVVLLADGKSDNASATVTEAGELRRLGIDVFAVGIGSGVDVNEMAAVATDSSKIFSVTDFDSLSTVCTSLVQAISKINGRWTVWGSWSTCSKSCGLGSRIRKRTCTDPCPANGGAICVGDDTINQACALGECSEKQVDGNWANWGFWSPCTATCGCGSQYRERTCSNPSPYNGGRECFGNDRETQGCGCASCPRDGAWTEWGGWGTCSKTCGGGTQSRSRSCTNPSAVNGGQECVGNSRDVRECFSDVCPVNGAFTTWGLWSACDQSCGGGERHRERFCSNPAPQNGGTDCVGLNTNTESCNSQQCPINGAWGGWSNWGQCSVTCANGIHTRQRSCDSPSPAFGGQICPGENSQTQVCTEKECPIDGSWSEWGCWSLCSKTCGIGQRSRERNCSNPCPAFGGRDCLGSTIDTDVCNTNPCATVPGVTTPPPTTTPPPPVNGGWSVWGQWTTCDATCGNGGLRMRTRECNNPTPDRGGNHCSGNQYDTGTCVLPACPVDGGFSEWSQWNACSLSCGTGTRFRTRACDQPTPSNGGAVCSGQTSEVVNCNTERCPVDGGWGLWTLWTACTESCGGGLQQRTRTCTNPFPVNGGKQCVGSSFQSNACSTNSCPMNGNWGAWSDWGACPVTCGGGQQFRQKSCDNPPPSGGGATCSGNFRESRQCATQSCPVDGNWAQWSLWSTCSLTCNTGLRRRQRDCTQPAPLSGGQYCIGDPKETETCNTQECPTDGQWGLWGPWNACSRTCGVGGQQRSRSCNNPVPTQGGQSCTGSGLETRTCGTQSCPVDGNWAAWTSWDTCTVACGGGTHTRTRTCTSPAPLNNGRYCIGADFESENCNTGLCVINGNWGEWNEWGACTVTCGNGQETRSRKCNNPTPLNGGNTCQGSSLDARGCSKPNCPVHGGWSLWESWSLCTTTCGGGVTTRSRECTSPAPLNGGKYCEGGNHFEKAVCEDVTCPTHGGLGQWGSWSTCTETCGGGSRSRTRSCDSPSPSNGGRSCTGNTFEQQECNLNLCPVNGNWNSWQYWSPCSSQCGTGAIRYRDRTCTSPAPLNGGTTCPDTSRQTEACPDIPCPVDGSWGQWSAYTNCPTTCGSSGLRESTRVCDSPPQANGGNFCEGDSKRYLTCSLPDCPVDGGPGEWGPWTSCSVTCGSGSRTRIRYCNNPTPKNSGAACDNNDLFMREVCVRDVCTTTTTTTTTTPAPTSPPVDGNWGVWNGWYACSVSCGGGTQQRNRACDSPAPSTMGSYCVGQRSESRDCNTQLCPIDGNWGTWGAFSQCSATCGRGTQTQIRGCDSPAPNSAGQPCFGSRENTIFCNTQNCPINGGWSFWGAWDSCTKTCDRGFQTSTRACVNPPASFGGDYCVGAPQRTQPCNEQNCPINGGLGNWGAWDPCSASCGTGSQRRERRCNNPAPSNGGLSCLPAQLSETQFCNTQLCPTTTTTTTTTPSPTISPVNGNWGFWSQWATCSRSCNQGSRSRIRECNNPPPNNKGSYCVGTNVDTETCNSQACPVHGNWGQWGLFPNCAVSCGGSTRTRSRQCNNPAPANNGFNCQGSSIESSTCNTQDCPIDGNWAQWNSWLPCSKTCGGGYQVAKRTCTSPAPANEGRYCQGFEQKDQDCNTFDCPIDGRISLWGAWSPCPVSCGSGIQRRERFCNNPAPSNGGAQCSESLISTQACVLPPCPTTTTTTTTTPRPTVPDIDGTWQSWSQWTQCGRTCGGSLQSRTRSCTPPSGNGQFCLGLNYGERACGNAACPVNGNWGSWGGFTACTATCGGGTYTRNRACNNPAPANGGFSCPGDSEDTQNCNTVPCPINGNWASWFEWSTCTKTCGSGTQFRYRTCDNPSPMYNGVNCQGDSRETKVCEDNPCPVNGGWGSWSAYGACSVSCGRGQYSRQRFCNSPSTLFGGRDCSGNTTETTICVMNPCPVGGTWALWGEWSQCTATCGRGDQFRERYCSNPPAAYGGNTCPGDKTVFRSCSTNACPVHGAWGQWKAWSSCSLTCGGGIQNRQRSCDSPSASAFGNPCVGDASESQSCSLQACPTNGAWSSWISNSCSSICGGGTLTRVRTCTNPAPLNNGLTCPGSDRQTDSCNTQDCPVNGGFGQWGRWNACSRTCGRGIQSRERACDSPSPLNGGFFCTGNQKESQECSNPPCSVDGQFSVWSGWNQCSRTCGKGVQFRHRTCSSPAPQGNGNTCTGDYWEIQDCTEQPCTTQAPPTTTPGVYITVECSVYNADIVFLVENNCDANIFNQEINLVKSTIKLFNLQTDATQISVVSYSGLQPTEHFDLKTYYNTEQMLDAVDKIQSQCGVRSTDTALRYVRTNSFTSQKGGRSNSVKIIILVTSGVSTNPTQTAQEATELRQSNVKTIAVGVGLFSYAELRSVAFNNDHVFTTNSANLLYTVRSGMLNSLCSVDGKWGAWGAAGPCSVTCGDGFQYKTRLCNNPPRAGSGKYCEGDNFEVNHCYPGDCPTTTTTTTTQATTTTLATVPPETCEYGTYFRRRDCRNPFPGAADCIGKEVCYYSSPTQCISVPPTTPPPIVIDPPELDNLPGCSSAQADIVFLVDKSTSVGGVQFRKILRFVYQFAQSLTIGQKELRSVW